MIFCCIFGHDSSTDSFAFQALILPFAMAQPWLNRGEIEVAHVGRKRGTFETRLFGQPYSGASTSSTSSTSSASSALMVGKSCNVA